MDLRTLSVKLGEWKPSLGFYLALVHLVDAWTRCRSSQTRERTEQSLKYPAKNHAHTLVIYSLFDAELQFFSVEDSCKSFERTGAVVVDRELPQLHTLSTIRKCYLCHFVILPSFCTSIVTSTGL